MGLKFDLKPRALEINLQNGLYVLPKDGGVGKSYIAKLLQVVVDAGNSSICVCRYIKGWASSDYKSLLLKRDYDIIFLDRMDLYVTKEICDAISICKNRGIVMLDLKTLNDDLSEFPLVAFIKFSREKIEVKCCANII